ncbi:hypothetical protein M405DRAFT_829426, partial [Rhizopogon salebrosus TDB-379]
TIGIRPSSGLDRHCASSSSSQLLPPCTLSILLALILLLAITILLIPAASSAARSSSCNVMDSGHNLFLWFKETAHCISMLLSCCACEGEAWTPEGRLRL